VRRLRRRERPAPADAAGAAEAANQAIRDARGDLLDHVTLLAREHGAVYRAPCTCPAGARCRAKSHWLPFDALLQEMT
jgi:hypothetical protein